MTLLEIYKQQAKHVKDSGYMVEVSSAFSWVDISPINQALEHEATVFMQGDDAVAFIESLEKMEKEVPGLDRGELELACAYPYMDCIT